MLEVLLSTFKAKLINCDVVFLEEDQFIETDNLHKGGCGQIYSVGCDCVAHREDSNEKDESAVFEVTQNTKPILEVASVAEAISAVADHVNLPIQPTHMKKHLCRKFLCLAQSIK